MSDQLPPSVSAPPGRAYEVLTPGEKFGDYQVLRCVSYDLLGSLYGVRKPRAKQEQTVFVMPPIIKATPDFKQRFAQVAPKLCGLEHENVFSFSEASEVKDRFTFLGDPFDGENLADYLQSYVNKQLKERRTENDEPRELVSDMPMGLPADQVTPILSQVLEGLTYLHQNKIQHFNLNPTNILRTKDGVVKVAGFGLLTLIGQERFEEIVSAGIPPIALGGRAIRINSVDILSPEARQGKPSDARSDVYALGITAYWLLTGRKPTADYTPPSEMVHGLDEKWDVFIANCLDREPEKRYQTVAKAKADFDEFDKIRPLRSSSARSSIGTSETKTIFHHLEFIPVPKQVKARGEKSARAFRLAVLGIVCLGVGFLVFSMLNSMIGDESMDGMTAIRTPEGQVPRLSISIFPESSSMKISSTDLNYIVRDGKLGLNILPGSYRLEFSSPGFTTTSRLIQIEQEPQSISVRLKPAFTNVSFTSLAETKLTAKDSDGEIIELGETNADGVLALEGKIPAGEYTITAKKDGYLVTKSGPFELSPSEDNRFDIPLDPILGVLRVKSDPSGAEIYYEDRKIGMTNATLQDLPVNEEFLLTLKLEGYRESILAVTVKPDTRDVLDFGVLTPLSGEIAPVIKLGGQEATPEQLKAVTISGKSVNAKLGDETFSANSSNIVAGQFRISDINEGEITMTVEHPDYLNETKTFTLENQVRMKVIYDLAPKPAILTLSPQPAGEQWTIELNGQKVKLDEMRAPLKPDVKQTLTISNENFFEMSKAFTPKPNEKLTWAPELTRIPSAETGKDYDVPFLKMPLVWVSPGSFTMGSPLTEPSRLPEEGPITQVRLTQGYWIGAHEVNQTQYEELIGFNPSRQAGKTRPVDYVSWREAMAFCSKLNEREQAAGRIPAGYEYRLPTEAEWEYAARAGTNTPFNWGATATAANGNFQGKYPRDFESSELDGTDHYGSKPVGSYPPNAWGLYDVHGNVREWCYDNYNARLPGDAVADWVRLEDNTRRPTRGGGWEDFAIRARAASRSEGLSEQSRSGSSGFRLVLARIIPE
ncbi:SUMF1/EgtB/PvdO family nonheme iron enzyme [Cerasicoccus arenae]|uniref:Protein kinase domain-containing protein n=1 Tax=Cerasicoccus arenae TaxID=424488 RepID=A0A8J3DEQ5_9BACT|nr:SUMF1/EgtB/PvdO family nonheme iron enzyme [Cerasicoccus arenae]MBK1856984.1 SUMF1/EgtB/PvdO family nonheme iron enzyme [Cerasicoccus arenae]GHB90223.1 hypothetical protein GCM10007047_01080 [Cerasicoccus arenae]